MSALPADAAIHPLLAVYGFCSLVQLPLLTAGPSAALPGLAACLLLSDVAGG